MNNKRMRPSSSDARSTAVANNDWKSTERRTHVVKRIAELLIQRAPAAWTQNPHAFMELVERFEKEVFDASRDEGEYKARIITKMKSNMPVRDPYAEWQEQVYQKIQAMKDKNKAKLYMLYCGISERRQKLNEYVLDDQVRSAIWRCKYHMYTIECISKIFRVKKSEITPEIHSKVKGAEFYLEFLDKNKHVGLQASQGEGTSGNNSASQVMGQQSSHLPEPVFHPVQIQFRNSHQDASLVSDKQDDGNVVQQQTSGEVAPPIIGTSGISAAPVLENLLLDDGNVVQQQTSGEVAPPIIGTSGISAAPVLENDNIDQDQTKISDDPSPEIQHLIDVQTSGEVAPPIIGTSGISAAPVLENDNIDQDQTKISDDPSPEIQHLIDVLNSVPTEALETACGDIGALVHLNDDISTLEPLTGPPIGSIGSDLEGVFVTDSQAKYLKRGKFVPRERKMNHVFDSTPIADGFGELPCLEKFLSNSNPIQETYAFLEEIEEIHRKLIDTEIVVDKEELIVPTVVENVEGFTVKLCFNSVTVNLNPMSGYAPPPKESMVDPVWLHIPSNYPECSVVILDDMPSHASMDPNNLSMKAHAKFRLSVRSLSETLSLKDIATLWDRCAREVILEYAKSQGGGTLSSKYGGWETCPGDDDGGGTFSLKYGGWETCAGDDDGGGTFSSKYGGWETWAGDDDDDAS